ncbi:MAG: protein phosphatase 2C domain-containing protein [Burkholderiales bacterium]
MVKGYRLIASTGIHKGDRDYQQDQVALLRHRNANGCVLGVVADGMGGRSGGRKASDQVMLTASQLFERYDPETDDATSLLLQLAREAHTVIKLTAISSEQEPHSTIAAFLINPGGDCHWVHAGDSRLYHFRLGKLVKRSLDHSYVQALVNAGKLDPSEAADHPKANILIGCLGTEAEPPLESHLITRVQPGDVIMACSDGIWHFFKDAELGELVALRSPRAATEQLIDMARTRSHGGGDNLSLVVVKIEPLTVPQAEADSAAAG